MPKKKSRSLFRDMRPIQSRVNLDGAPAAPSPEKREELRKALEDMRREIAENGGLETPELTRAFTRMDKASESAERAIEDLEQAARNDSRALLSFASDPTKEKMRAREAAKKKAAKADEEWTAAMRELRNALAEYESAMQAHRDGGRPLSRAERRRRERNPTPDTDAAFLNVRL